MAEKDFVLKNLITGAFLKDTEGGATFNLTKALHMDNAQKLSDLGRAIGDDKGWKAFASVHGDTGTVDIKRPIT